MQAKRYANKNSELDVPLSFENMLLKVLLVAVAVARYRYHIKYAYAQVLLINDEHDVICVIDEPILKLLYCYCRSCCCFHFIFHFNFLLIQF